MGGMTDDAPSVFRDGGLTYLHIPCLEPARAARFYEAVFGWTLRPGEEPGFSDPTGHVIGHFVAGQPTLAEDGPRPFIYVDDLHGALGLIARHGGRSASPARPEGTLRVATFHDPEGNLIGVWTETRRPG
jgi:uncharacterized protein